MEFRAAAEVFHPASDNLRRVSLLVEPLLKAALAGPTLASLKVELRYVPIVMPKDMQAIYKERSRVHKKERAYDCAPHLNYKTFVDGKFEDQIQEYIRGISNAAPHLAHLGATKQQITDFKVILAEAAARILLDKGRLH